MPKVSVLGKSYNDEKYVGQTIRSVLAQTFRDFELIVCDDGSTDGNVAEIRKFNDPRLTLICHEINEGVPVAAATAWRRSSGNYVAWLDTDDIWEPHMLELLVSYLDSHPDVLGVFGLPRLIDGDGHPLEHHWDERGVGADRYQLLNLLFRRERPFCAPCVLLRRQILEEVGFFPSHFAQSHDTSHWIRILFRGTLVLIPEYVIQYRRHAGGETHASPACHNRGAFENFELLFHYLDEIKDAELLLKIFPEASQHPWPINDRLTSFHLAHLALSGEHPCNNLFGLHVLHEMLGQHSMAEYVRSTCNFTLRDLQRLKETKSVFADGEIVCAIEASRLELAASRLELAASRREIAASRSAVETLQEANDSLIRANAELERYGRGLAREIATMANTRAWKLATVFRHARSLLGLPRRHS